MRNYKNRFFNLLESEMGNVKPLINESGSLYSDFDFDRMNSDEDMTYKPNRGDLRNEIMDLLRNDISSKEEKISLLRMIADEMESSNKLTNDVRKRFREDK